MYTNLRKKTYNGRMEDAQEAVLNFVLKESDHAKDY